MLQNLPKEHPPNKKKKQKSKAIVTHGPPRQSIDRPVCQETHTLTLILVDPCRGPSQIRLDYDTSSLRIVQRSQDIECSSSLHGG